MTLFMLGSLLGGVGLFLLGMRLMTDGLKYAAGISLRNILARSTGTPLLGMFSGAFLTSIVQSSSAVTVATIGFVNAGLMDLTQAVSLIYGSNVGTTMTGWLVSLVGFQLNVKAVALPAVGLGMLLQIIRPQDRLAAIGEVLTGFGLFFVGIDVLKATFAVPGQSLDLVSWTNHGFFSVLLFVFAGFMLTCMMQSSSAAIAVILTAVAGGLVQFQDAAAVVIGANVGTTSTAALSVIGATPNAKRLAAIHVIFNLMTGLAAFLLLSPLLKFLRETQMIIGLHSSPAMQLAIFHTTFNILGVLLFYPLTGWLVFFMENRFRTAEEDESRPQFLDHTVLVTPVLALHALAMELRRIGIIARRMAKGAISAESAAGPRLSSDRTVIAKLIEAVAQFCNKMQRGTVPAALSHQLPNGLRVSAYYHDVAELSIDLARLQSRIDRGFEHGDLNDEVARFKSNTVKLLKKVDIDLEEYSSSLCAEDLENIKNDYRSLKSGLLKAATREEISVSRMAHWLEIIARIRRIAEQSEKGARYLAALARVEKKIAEDEESKEEKRKGD